MARERGKAQGLSIPMSTAGIDLNAIAHQLYRFDRSVELLPSPEAITDAHVDRYRRDGFLAVANIFTPEEVADAKDGLGRLMSGGVPDFEGITFEPGTDLSRLTTSEEREPFVRKVWRFTKHEARLAAAAENPRLLAVCRRLVDAEVKLVQDMALLKPAFRGSEKPWHQDAAYFRIEPADGVIGTWTALDPATAENGCMHLIPGSHRTGPVPHYHDRDCQLPDDVVAVEEDVMAPLPPGATLFFHGLLHHGTPPNQSAARRWALQFHYAAEHCRSIDADRHGEIFRDGAGQAGCVPPRSIKTRS